MIYTPHEVLKKYWGFDSFRPLQEDIIKSVLNGNDTLALLPTGGGKSICFQVPALCLDGVCLVITPLVALMVDQVENLTRIGISAVALHSGMRGREIDIAFGKCMNGDARFLYISPERLETRKFQEILRQVNITLIAVDEAHCISQWGYDFRPPYLRIASIRDLFPYVTILALTATAVPKVVSDIQQKLLFRKENVFTKSFVRNNLAYIVSKEDDKMKKLLRICNGVQGCGIVYVRNRKLTREVATFLMSNGISASYYHAGLDPTTRTVRQHEWMSNKTRVIVATNAFGMGIDKPDVRFVVHIDMPENLEAYYQEAGRAGRDGKKSYAVLLFNDHDIANTRKNIELAWPAPDEIRNVYQALGNYLQLPVGAGKDQSFDFEIEKFCANYNLKPITAFNSIKILERDGYLSLNEVWDQPSRLIFTCSKEDLYSFQLENPEIDKVIRLVLRSYSGVFTDFTRISENDLARRSGNDSTKVISILKELHKIGFIEYIPQNMKPQLVFSRERLDSKDITLSKTFYIERKKDAFQKYKSMVMYAEELRDCRSLMLVKYFGETNSKRCNVCDTCLAQNRAGLTTEKSVEIEKLIRQAIGNEVIEIGSLIVMIPSQAEQNILTILRCMIEEGKININGENVALSS